MERVWRDRDVSAIDDLHDEAFIDRSPAGPRGVDRAAYAAAAAELFAAFPDFEAVTEGLAVDRRRGQVTVRWTATGTHRGAFLGVAPTGEVVRFQGIEILKIRRGRIRERWGEWDGLAILDQLVASRAQQVCATGLMDRTWSPTPARTPTRRRRAASSRRPARKSARRPSRPTTRGGASRRSRAARRPPR